MSKKINPHLQSHGGKFGKKGRIWCCWFDAVDGEKTVLFHRFSDRFAADSQ